MPESEPGVGVAGGAGKPPLGVGVGVGVGVEVSSGVPPRSKLRGAVGTTGAGETGEFWACAGAAGTTTVAIALTMPAAPTAIAWFIGVLKLENRCFSVIDKLLLNY